MNIVCVCTHICTRVGKSRLIINTIINKYKNKIFCILITINLLWPTPVYIVTPCCLFLYVSLYVENHDFTLYSQFQFPTTWKVGEFSFRVFVIPFSDRRLAHIILMYLLIWQLHCIDNLLWNFYPFRGLMPLHSTQLTPHSWMSAHSIQTPFQSCLGMNLWLEKCFDKKTIQTGWKIVLIT